MDKVIYTGKVTKEEVSKRLNKIINEYLHELHEKSEEELEVINS